MKKNGNREDIQENICTIISQILENEYELFEEDWNLFNDIGLDSIGFLELAIKIQGFYDIDVTHEEWSGIKTLKDILDIITAKIKGNGKI